jgi:hypothetical protein
MEQEITHYSRDKLHVGQITVRESARSTKQLFEIGALLHVNTVASNHFHSVKILLFSSRDFDGM